MIGTNLSVQKVLSGSGRVERLYLTGKYIHHVINARPEPDNYFPDSTWTYSKTVVLTLFNQKEFDFFKSFIYVKKK